jgi:hypothetical protein
VQRLGFVPQRAVRWLSPTELARTGLATILAGIFGVYADKREQQDGRSFDQDVFVHDGQWLDFVADVGDGFDATYTVASLVAADGLTVEGVDLPRGEVLVMGGDEVYPSASTVAYEQRTTRPYRAAFPDSAQPADANPSAPVLYAIPGNHDWYDGLTAFLRVFAQGENVGGWRTAQRRSYFALKLPHRWWVLAIDIQLDTYIDEPQLAYFRRIAAELSEGDGIILCTARPSWYDVADGEGSNSIHRLEYFARKIVNPTGARIRLILTGDAHHYARYTSPETGQTLLTCGIGGAYTAATHKLTDVIELGPRLSAREAAAPAPAPAGAATEPAGGFTVTETRSEAAPTPPSEPDGPPVRYELADATWPPRKTSARLGWGVFKLPFRNLGFWWLTGGAHAGFLAALISKSFLWTILWGAIVGGSAVGFTDRIPGTWTRRLRFGIPHAAVQLALGVTAWMVFRPLTAHWRPLLALLASIPASVLVTGFLSAEIVAAYLLIASLRRAHLNELFAAQSIEDWKGFARIHIGPDALTVHPIVVAKANRSWVWRDGRLVAADPLKTQFAERPFSITRSS